MERSEPTVDESPSGPGADVDVVVIGAGITGIYQTYRAREAGLSVTLLEAGGGVGGTWYWNRYPGARFDSESYTYAYLFSRELFEEWEWQEHFAQQPEIEGYLNHVVDRFDLRRHIRFDSLVTSAVFDGPSATWTVVLADGSEIRARFVVAATGVLSVPYFPDVPGREDFRGESYHTGLWPPGPVDFAGKRVAVIGTGSSGVQVIPAIAESAASLTVYQRTANWCTPLNNAPITPDEQARLRADFEAIRETLNTSVSGFLHPVHDRAVSDDSEEERRAFFEKMWNSPGFSKLTSNYTDLLFDQTANTEWCEFLADKIRGIVDDPETAERLIPKDHLYAAKRPPFVTNYFEVYNNDNVSLVDLNQSPMVRVTEHGIQTSEGEQEFDIVVWATGFDFGTGALLRMGIVGRDGLALEEYWADGPLTFLGLQTAGFPNLFFPGGPHAAAGNNPRYNGDQVDFVTELLTYMGEHDYDVIEVDPDAEARWTKMVDSGAKSSPFGESSYFFGSNIPGKAPPLPLELGGPTQALLGHGLRTQERVSGLPVLARHLRNGGRRRAVAMADSLDRGDRRQRTAHNPGKPQRGGGEQEPAPVVLAQPRRQLVQVPKLAERDAQPEQAEMVDGKQRMSALVAVPADQSLDGIVVGDEGRDLRVSDPLQQRWVTSVEIRTQRVDLHRIGVAIHGQDLGGETSVKQQHVARFHDDVVRLHDPLERLQVDTAPVVAQVVGQVDEDAAPLHTLEGHVLEAQVVSEAAVSTAVAPRVRLRSDQVDTGSIPVVVDRLFDPVAVGVELRPDVGQRVPLGGVLQREGHLVVGPDVDETRTALVHLTHVDVVEGVGDVMHVLGRSQHWRVAPLVQRRPARVVERQAQTETDAGLHLAHALEHLGGGEQIDPAQLVVLAPVAPRRAGRALCPALRHWSSSRRNRAIRGPVACTDRLVDQRGNLSRDHCVVARASPPSG
jgi:cation diffusion facilitator CzcD-associated flavoprotein CzcO